MKPSVTFDIKNLIVPFMLSEKYNPTNGHYYTIFWIEMAIYSENFDVEYLEVKTWLLRCFVNYRFTFVSYVGFYGVDTI